MGRECDEESTSPAEFIPEEYKVCFSALGKCPDGFLLDSGKVLSPQDEGVEYGWGIDAHAMLRARDKNI